MIREIVRDQFFLRLPSRAASAADAAVADDLLDTLRANAGRCAGMAANMIGVNVRIIAFLDGGRAEEMFNPVLLGREGPYEADEGCLSLDGTRPARRYRTVSVRWQTRGGQTRTRTFTGFTAQVIQHEMDHLEGILI